MGGRDQVVAADRQVVDGGHRQVAVERQPGRAVVAGDEQAALGAGVQQPGTLGILAYHPGEVVCGKIAADPGPGGAVIRGLEQVRRVVVELVAEGGHVGGRRVVRRELDGGHGRPLGQLGRRDLLPIAAAVTGQVHQPVVGTGPEQPLPVRRLGEGEDGAVVLGAAGILGDRTAGRLLPALVVAGQVGADHLPARALVGGTEQHVAGDVEHVGVVRGDQDRVGPLESVPEVPGPVAGKLLRPGSDDAGLRGRMVITQQHAAPAGRAADGAGVDDVGVVGAHLDVAALGVADRVAFGIADDAPVRTAGYGDRGVVLLRAVHSVWEPGIGGEVVELRGRLVVDRGPGVAAVERHAGAAVVALDHAVRVGRVDPQVVVVAVRGRHRGEGVAGVGGLPRLQVQHPHGVGVPRIGEHVVVVPGALAQLALGARHLPVGAAVLGTEQRTLLRLDDGPHPSRPGRGAGDADAALDALRQAGIVADLGPGVAAVGGLEDAASGPARLQDPGPADHLPQRRVQDARIGGVDAEVDGAGLCIAEQHPLPVGAAVAGAEHAALLVGPEGVAERGHVDQVRVPWMDANAADVAGVGQADVAPGRAAVGRPVDAVAVRDVHADARLAGAGVDDVGIGVGNRDRAHRGGPEVVVRDVLPVGAAVGGLPDAAGTAAEVERLRLRGIPGHRHHAAAAVRPDAAPLDRLEQFGCKVRASHEQ